MTTFDEMVNLETFSSPNPFGLIGIVLQLVMVFRT
jgi:hypothetical protein